MTRTRWLMAAAVISVAVIGLAGCSGSTHSTSSGSSEAAVPKPADAGVAQQDSGSAAAATPALAGQRAAAGAPDAAETASGSAAGSSTGVLPASVAGVKLVRTADVAVQVDDLSGAAAQVRAAATAFGGTVASETTSFSDNPLPVEPASGTVGSANGSSDGSGTGSGTSSQARVTRPGESVIVLKVPVDSLDRAIDRVVQTGKVLSRTSSSEDVTANLADLGSRVKTQQASVDRVRALLARAGSLQEIVLLEGELTRREADLEALQAANASLAGRAALSTLTVTLRTPATVTSTQPQSDDGFVGGLKQGWRAVVRSTTVVLTVLGALLPLLIVVALIGTPIWWVLRRRAGRRQAAVPTAGPTGPGPAGPGPAGPAGPGPAGAGPGPADRQPVTTGPPSGPPSP
jgi:hypothetical protein